MPIHDTDVPTLRLLRRTWTVTPPARATCASAAASPINQTRLVLGTTPSGGLFDRLARDLDDLVDLVPFDDQRRRHGDEIAALADLQGELEGFHEGVVATRTGRILATLEVDATGKAEVANVGHSR